MSDRHFGMIGFVEHVSPEELSQQVDSALVALGLNRSAGESSYVDAEGRNVNCTCGAPTGHLWPNSRPAWAVFPIEYASCELQGATFLASVFRALCRGTAAIIARSFHPTGLDMLNEGELEGLVDYVDWIQYYGPMVATAVGPERIRAAGFCQLEEFPDGAVMALARASYNGGDLPERKAIIEKLGITPRRITIRNPKTGEPTQFKWWA